MKLQWSIKTVIRKDKIKADGLIPINFSIRVGPACNRVSTGKYILLKDWNEKECCPKKVGRINQLLASYLTTQMNKWHIYMLQLENLGKPITLTIACNFFNQDTKVTFFSFFQEQIDLWLISKEPNTLRSYRSTLNVLKQFAPKLNFGDLSYDMVQRFDLWMSQKRHNSIGGRFGRHKCLKAVINEAIKKGFLASDQNPYRYFKVKSAIGNRQFLSIEEVRKLIDLEIPEKNTFLSKVRDLFLFSCFCGLRYSDVMNLKWRDISPENTFIKITTTKTKKPLLIPLQVGARKIIEKYGKHTIKSPEGKVLPQMANQVINRELKILMEKAGITKKISFHCARHS